MASFVEDDDLAQALEDMDIPTFDEFLEESTNIENPAGTSSSDANDLGDELVLNGGDILFEVSTSTNP